MATLMASSLSLSIYPTWAICALRNAMFFVRPDSNAARAAAWIYKCKPASTSCAHGDTGAP